MLTPTGPYEAEAADTKATDRINYDVAVAEGKEIIAQSDAGELRLGELADRIEPKYAKNTLARFAAEIGIAACTLARRRDVYRAWAAISAPERISYSVMKELATHPDRADLVKADPDMSKREAHALMLRYKAKQNAKGGQENGKDNPADDLRRKEYKRWFLLVVKLAQEAITEAAIVK